MKKTTPTADTEAIIALLEEIRELMQLNGENPFKVRAFEKAAGLLEGATDLRIRAEKGSLTELTGIGKGIAEVITDFLLHEKAPVRDELQKALPKGLIELTQISGLGAKKAKVLIEELEIHSIAELEYACRENRLLDLKGFGEKAQQKILEQIQFLKSTEGQLKLGDALPLAAELRAELVELLGEKVAVMEVGLLRRRAQILDRIEFLIQTEDSKTQKKATEWLEKYRKKNSLKIPVEFHFSGEKSFGFEQAKLTASPEHWKKLGSPTAFSAKTEEEVYKKQGYAWIPPEMRETGEELEQAQKGKLAQVLAEDALQGIFHNHTTYSDGTASVEEMVKQARKLGYKYIGISDHSQSAFYAHGLKKDDLKKQEKEIRTVQEKYPDIRIFWGVESDILADGNLDYEPAVLKKFDFVIASIHSRFQMDRAQMTERILKALDHPCTRFLGHVTGRLLLGRPGYDLDMEKIIERAAKRDVAIEFNANPARLDIDWKWGKTLRENQTKVSINPDAHSIEGLEDTRYGIWMARKALMPTQLVMNAQSVREVERWLKQE